VALASGHPLAERDTPLHLVELEGLALMLWPREVAPDYYDALLAVCEKSGISPAVIPGPRRAIIRSYALSEGDVFYLLPDPTSRLSVPGITFLPVVDEHATVPLTLVHRQHEDRVDVLAAVAILTEVVPCL
jgi:hypothetical protein